MRRGRNCGVTAKVEMVEVSRADKSKIDENEKAGLDLHDMIAVRPQTSVLTLNRIRYYRNSFKTVQFELLQTATDLGPCGKRITPVGTMSVSHKASPPFLLVGNSLRLSTKGWPG